jgi:hypothetical protein
MLGPEADHLREDTSELERAPTGIVTSLESLDKVRYFSHIIIGR